MRVTTVRVWLAASFVLVATGCAGGSGSTLLESDAPWAPKRASLPAEVTREGTVLEDEDGPRLCLGMVLDSYPPQCDGPSILGWDWDAVEGETSAVGTTWGDYEVQGVWDGERFTPTRPAVLFTPRTAPVEGNVSDRWDRTCEPQGPPVLPALREAVAEIVSVMTDLAGGCVVVEVEYDDGTLQAAVDERFGDGAIVIGSSFTSVDGD